MIRFKPPRIAEVVRRSQVMETVPDPTRDTKKLMVISVFGSSHYFTQRQPGFKRAFQLALDGFGSLSLFSKGEMGWNSEDSANSETVNVSIH